MKYYKIIQNLLIFYDLCNNGNTYTDDVKFVNIEKDIYELSKNTFLNDEYKYFLMKFDTIKNYYLEKEDEIRNNNLVCSYSIDDEDHIKDACIEVINYIYELFLLNENENKLDLYKKYFYSYIDKDLLYKEI
jgi:hypothetical protein